MKKTTYYIGVPHEKGSMFWTGEAFSSGLYGAKSYSHKGARVAIKRLSKRLNLDLTIIGDSKNGEYSKNPQWWQSYVLSSNAQLSNNFPKHPQANRYK